jgi:hypothetical protein
MREGGGGEAEGEGVRDDARPRVTVSLNSLIHLRGEATRRCVLAPRPKEVLRDK